MTDRSADITAISQLLQRFAMLADTAENVEDYLALVTDDVALVYPPVAEIGWAGATYAGRDALRVGVEDRREQGMQGPGTSTLHVVSDIVVDFTSDSEANAYAAWHYWGMRDGHPACLTMGQYRNVVRLVDGQWLIARRDVTVF